MREAPIEELRDRFRYDPATGEIYWKNPEDNPSRRPGPLGYMHKGYLHINIGKMNLRAHRMAWAMHYGEWPDGIIDHIDRVPTNNRIDNLRVVSFRQNSINSGSKGAVAAKGVWIEQRNGKYRAAILIGDRLKHLGGFDSEDEAAHAYNKMAVAYYGEFAVLNPIGVDKAASNQASLEITAAMRVAYERAAKLCDAADKSAHPADLAAAIRALAHQSTANNAEPADQKNKGDQA